MRRMTKFFVKSSLLAAGLLIAGLSLGQDQSAKVTFRHPAAPLGRVLAELSKAANTSLVASAPISSDVILLNLKDVSVQDAMAKIASTLHAEWKQEGSGYVLYRGTNLIAADQRAETAAKVALFREQIKKTQASQTGKFDEKTAQKIADSQKKLMDQINNGGGGRAISVKGDFNDVATQTPASRAITSLVASMSDAQLGMIANRKRVVFSNSPTRMQYALGNAANQILRRFVQEQLVLTNYNKRNQREEQDGFSQRVVINGFGNDEMGDGDPSLGVGYAMLVSNSNSFGRGANASLSLIVTDPNGKTLATGSMFLGNGPFPQQNGNQAATQTQEKPIELSPEALELAKAIGVGSGGGPGGAVRMMAFSVGGGGAMTFTSTGAGGKTPQISDSLREKVLQPELYEPMGFAPSEAFMASADQLNRNLVAYLPDTSYAMLSQAAATGKVTPSAFLAAAKQGGDLDVVDENGWLLVSPKTPATARDRYTNRLALGNALKTLNKKGYLSLDEMATYALQMVKEPRNGDIDQLYMRLISTPYAQTMEQYGFGNSWQMLQFYGCLSTGQKQSMLQTGRIDMSTLSNQQLNLLAEDVFSSFDGPEVKQPQEQNQRRRAPIRLGGVSNPQTERTIVLPNGIVRNGYITVDIQDKQGVQAFNTQAGGAQFMNTDTLAFDRLRMENPEVINFGGEDSHPDKFRAASQKVFNFRFEFSPEVSLSRQLEDNTPANTSYGTYQQLPDDLRRAVDQRLEALRQGFGKGFPGRQGNPPPRP